MLPSRQVYYGARPGLVMFPTGRNTGVALTAKNMIVEDGRNRVLK